jgi:hypothetical protein
MRPLWHFCGMAAAAPGSPLPSRPGPVSECARAVPIHPAPALDSKGMDPFARRQEQR